MIIAPWPVHQKCWRVCLLQRQNQGACSATGEVVHLSGESSPTSSSTASSSQNASIEQLEVHLCAISHWEVTLWQELDEVLHQLERRRSDEVMQLWQEVQALWQHVQYKEGENRRPLKPDRELRPVIVRYLESIPPTRALVLYPASGNTSVFPLDGQNMCSLDLVYRTPCQSSGALLCTIIVSIL